MVNGEINGQDLEDTLADKIITTREFKSSKAGRVFEKLKQVSGGFKKMIQKFDGDFPVSHLRFRLANDMPSNVYGQTLRPENYITTIKINGESINEISNLGTALVLSHEVTHAEIYRKMLFVARKGELDYRGWPRKDWDKYFKSLQKDFPGIFDYYFRYEWETISGQPLSDAQHEQMANYYISKIANILKILIKEGYLARFMRIYLG